MREVIRSLILAAMVVASESGLEAAEGMSTYKWKYRPLVVFADSDDNANFAAQRRILTNNRAGFAERNMVVVLVVGDNVSAQLGPEPHQSAAALSVALRSHLQCFSGCARWQGRRLETVVLCTAQRRKAVRDYRCHADAPRRNAKALVVRDINSKSRANVRLRM